MYCYSCLDLQKLLKVEIKKVFLVGAGPGDPDLLTIKAYKCLQKAEFVLYDELFGDDILGLLPSGCEKMYAGKRHNDMQSQSERQERIHRIMKEQHGLGKSVVRLKTGDPLIFGRGIEEARFLNANGIPYELIPGITAGMAAASAFSIPLTERQKNAAVLFCTGHTLKEGSAHFADIAVFISKGNPVVIYMGLKKLPEIIGVLIENGIPANTPICAVSQVSGAGQDIVEGCFADISAKLEQHPLALPTVVIMGMYAATVS
jgi:uroporphyrin-III C-methyltransferase